MRTDIHSPRLFSKNLSALTKQSRASTGNILFRRKAISSTRGGFHPKGISPASADFILTYQLDFNFSPSVDKLAFPHLSTSAENLFAKRSFWTFPLNNFPQLIFWWISKRVFHLIFHSFSHLVFHLWELIVLRAKSFKNAPFRSFPRFPRPLLLLLLRS